MDTYCILVVACEAVRAGQKGDCSINWGDMVGHLGVVGTVTLTRFEKICGDIPPLNL